MTRNRPVSHMHAIKSHRADTDVVLLVPVSFAKRVCNGFAQLGQHARTPENCSTTHSVHQVLVEYL